MTAEAVELFTLAFLGLGTWTVAVWGLTEIVASEITRRCGPVREGTDGR